jgi:diguanylate cyclase (GGDEF)-like protein/hemerythrin-like metal-binding protein
MQPGPAFRRPVIATIKEGLPMNDQKAFSLEQLSEFLSSLPDPVFVLTRTGQYAAIFGGSDSRYYHDGSSLIGLNLKDVLVPEKATWFLMEIEKALEGNGLHIVEYELSGQDVKGIGDRGPSAVIRFEGRITRLNFPVMEEDAVLWVASNITDRHLLQEKLRSLSETDSLTGLWNRRYFEKASTHERERALRYNHRVSLMIYDIDNFKMINDSRGHKTGDDILRELSSLISGSIRESDILTRWGGEEFALLMPGIGLDSAIQVAEKLRRLSEEHLFGPGIRVTISAGVAEWYLKNECVDHLISRTDEALYLAKHRGRNRIETVPQRAIEDHHTELEQFPYFFEWRKSYESGNHQLDRQHKSLFDCAQDLMKMAASATTSNAPESALREALLHVDRLLKDLKVHFRDEEKILSDIGWPCKDEHCRKHQLLLSRCQELRQRLEEHPPSGSILEFINYVVQNVVFNHMVKDDREFFSSLK